MKYKKPSKGCFDGFSRFCPSCEGKPEGICLSSVAELAGKSNWLVDNTSKYTERIEKA